MLPEKLSKFKYVHKKHTKISYEEIYDSIDFFIAIFYSYREE